MSGHPRDVCARRGCGHRRMDHRRDAWQDAAGATTVVYDGECTVERGGVRSDTCPRFMEREEDQPQGAHRDTRPIRAQRAERREMKPLLRGDPAPAPVKLPTPKPGFFARVARRRWWLLPTVGVVLLLGLTAAVLSFVAWADQKRQQAVDQLPPTTTASTSAAPFEPTLDQVLDGYWWVALQREELVQISPDRVAGTAAARGVCQRLDAGPNTLTAAAEVQAVEDQNVTRDGAEAWVELAVEVYCPSYLPLLP